MIDIVGIFFFIMESISNCYFFIKSDIVSSCDNLIFFII